MWSVAVMMFGSLMVGTVAAAENRVCVLNFEREMHPYTKLVNETFTGRADIRVINEAKPIHFVDCIRDGFEEIIFIAHAMKMDESGKHYTLGYFSRKSQDVRDRELEALKKELREKVAETEDEEFDFFNSGHSYEYSSSRSALKRLNALPPDWPLYDSLIILPRVFDLAEREIQRKLKGDGFLNLKRIRLATCVPEIIMKTYPGLASLVRDHGIALDFSPKVKIVSFFQGRNVSTITARWLKQSL